MFKKSFKNLLKILGFKKEKKYLKELIDNVESLYKSESKVTYTVYQPRQKGFVVKVSGLFAFVSFKHMPWRYPNYRYWSLISKHLIKKKFYCTIHKVKRNPLLVLIDGKIHLFKKIELKKLGEYRGILLQKNRNTCLVDIGYHFNWEYGSFLGTLHFSDISDNIFEKHEEGNEILVRYLGHSTDEDVNLSDTSIPIEWYNGDIKKMVGTNQDVTVFLNNENRREYIIHNKYLCKTPATKELYGADRDVVEEKLKNMTIDITLSCIIIAADETDKTLIIKVFL